MTNSTRRIGVCAAMLFAAALFGTHRRLAAEGGAKQAPIFEVDPFWPKPLPNHWVTGSTIGLSVDAQDNVWTIHRPNTVEDNFKAADIKVGDARGRDDEAQPGAPSAQPTRGSAPIGKCCKVAPPVLVYDQAGNLVKSWGGPGQGYDWPDSNHGITVDHKGNVWLAGNGAEGHADPEVQRRRGVPVPDRASTASTTAATTSRTSGSRRRSAKTCRPTRCTSPTATATAASSCSTPTPASTSGTGARTATKPSDEKMPRVQPERRRRRSSSTRCTARSSRTTASSTSATG